MAVNDNFPERWSLDRTASRILHTRHGSSDSGSYLGILESKVAIGSKFAIHEGQISCIAQRLCTGNLATYECEAARMPTEILADKFGIVDSDMLGAPESILGMDHGIPNLHILTILEGIIAVLTPAKLNTR